MKKLLMFLLVFIVAFSSVSMFGCGGTPPTTPSGDGAKPEAQYKDTEIDLVLLGKTNYTIVIPAKSEYEEEFAASEFKNIFSMSTGINLNIIRDSQEMQTSGYYFAIGDTTLKEKAGITHSILDKENAFRVARKDNTVIMAGIDLPGTVFATYEFLEAQLGYRYYAADEIYVDEVVSEKLIDIDFEYAPFLTRNATTQSVSASKESAYRLFSTRPDWSLGWPHNYLSIVKRTDYEEQHSDWYTAGADGYYAICLTKTDLQETFAVNMVDHLLANGYTSGMMGQEDSWTRCGCDGCKASDEIYTQAGTNILFVNNVAKLMDAEIERRKQEDPTFELDYELVLLAYYQNETPPVEKQADGTWKPVKTVNGQKVYAEELMLHDRVGVQICLFYGDGGAPFLSDKNSSIVKDSYGWQALSGGDKTEYWCYRGYFVQYDMMFYNDWAYIADWMKGIEQFNCRQGKWDSLDYYIFSRMRAYVMAQLSYDINQGTNDLIEDFIKHYYKEAAPYIQEFFDSVTAHLNVKKAEYEANGQDFGFYVLGKSQHQNLYKAETWPQQILLYWNELFEKAHEAIDNSDHTALEKEILNVRVANDGIFSKYWNLKFYGDTYPAGELARMQEEVLEEAYQIGYDSGYVKFN